MSPYRFVDVDPEIYIEIPGEEEHSLDI